MRSAVLLLAGVAAACGAGDGTVGGQGGGGGELAGTPVTEVGLALRAEEPFERDMQVPLEVVALLSDDTERPLGEGEGVTFEVSDERIVQVEEGPVARFFAGGDFQITARWGGHEATLQGTATCPYPENDDKLARGQVIPSLSWPAMRADGSSFTLRLEDVHCDVEWSDVTSLALLVHTEWCPYCREMTKDLVELKPQLNAAGMELVFVMVETRYGNPGTVSSGRTHIEELTGGILPGMVVADPDSIPFPNFFKQGGVRGFPSTFVVRTRDMRIINGRGHYATKAEALLPIAQNPEGQWGAFFDRCSPGDNEASEPNDTLQDGAVVGPGLHHGGICSDGDEDIYRVEAEGEYRFTVRWNPDRTDPLLINGGSLAPAPAPASAGPGVGDLGNQEETITLQGPAWVRIRGASALQGGPYTLEITEL